MAHLDAKHSNRSNHSQSLSIAGGNDSIRGKGDFVTFNNGNRSVDSEIRGAVF